jgi:uncharacterized membrane protein
MERSDCERLSSGEITISSPHTVFCMEGRYGQDVIMILTFIISLILISVSTYWYNIIFNEQKK